MKRNGQRTPTTSSPGASRSGNGGATAVAVAEATSVDLADAFLGKLEGPDKLCREIEGLLKAQGPTAPDSSHGH